MLRSPLFEADRLPGRNAGPRTVRAVQAVTGCLPSCGQIQPRDLPGMRFSRRHLARMETWRGAHLRPWGCGQAAAASEPIAGVPTRGVSANLPQEAPERVLPLWPLGSLWFWLSGSLQPGMNGWEPGGHGDWRSGAEPWWSQACLPGQAVGGRTGCSLLEGPGQSSGGAESRAGLVHAPALP